MNLRPQEKFLNQLAAYQSYDKVEEVLRLQTIKFVQQYENCFSKENTVGHITGSAWLVDFFEEKFLLTLHRKCRIWLQCGGHSEGESDPLKIALREVREESGLTHIIPLKSEIFDIDVHYFTGNGKSAPHWHYDIRYLFKVSNPHDRIHSSSESLDLRWFKHPPSPQHPHFLGRLYQKWVFHRQYL